MTRKRIVIHAGLPKTATSFLQENVFPHISSEECAFNPAPINHLLLEMCKELVTGARISSERIDAMRALVDREIEKIDAPVLLISVEGLLPLHCGGFDRSDRILRILKKLFDNPVIIVFLREQSAWIRSAYSFCLVSKFILPFDQFVNRESEGQFANRVSGLLSVDVFDYSFPAIRGLVKQHFETSYYFSFEELFEHQATVLQRLAGIIGVSELAVHSDGQVNKGLDEGLMVLLSKTVAAVPFRKRWRKKYLFRRYVRLGLREKISWHYLRLTGRLAMIISRMLYQFTDQSSGAKLFSSQEVQQIKDFYRESNRQFWAAEAERS